MIKQNNEFLTKDYFDDLNKIKETIRLNQNKAMVYVNSQMIMTYYEIGTIINERKTWGSKYIQKLSQDLAEYGKGYPYESLKRMGRFANTFSKKEITPQVVAKISWATLDLIISKSKTHSEMLYYINETHKNGWSRSMVLNQIEMKTYERSLIEPTTSTSVKRGDLSKNYLYVQKEK